MTAWSPAQLGLRAEWGLADLEREPLFHAIVDPAYYPPAKPAVPRPVPPMTAAEMAAAIVADYYRQRTKFRREVPLERARLAYLDPDGEAEALVPLAPSRARHTLREAAKASLKTTFKPFHQDRRESGRELLTRLGADSTATSGMLPCPAHEDERPSLSWKLAGDKVLVHCFAGCSFADVLAASS